MRTSAEPVRTAAAWVAGERRGLVAIRGVLGAVSLAIPLGALAAQAPQATVRMIRTTEPIRLDGVPGEPAWLTADSIAEFRQFDPREGAPATERTVVRFLRDDRALYVGIWCYDRDMRRLRRSQLRRDGPLGRDDNVMLLLDPALDRRSGVLFAVNANGALWDAEVGGSSTVNEYWNGVWDARAAVGEDGWTAELTIPFQVLRTRDHADRVGLNVGRYIRRKNEWVLWRGWLRQQGILFQDEEGVLESVGALPSRRPLEIKPFATVAHATGPSTAGPVGPSGTEAGVDAKLAIASSLTLDLTANTDFAQADVDALVLNLSRFPLFFPEQREFFLESAPVFDFGEPGDVSVFHSRRIGLDSAGAPVPIIAGARLTGRAGAQRLGLLAVRTGGTDDAFDFVGRVRRDLFSRGSVGGIATLQAGPGVHGAPGAAGLDFHVPAVVHGRNVLSSGYVATTFGAPGGRAGVAWRLGVEYPNDGARHGFAIGRVGESFDPSLGFVRQAGVWELLGALRFYPRPGRWGIRRLLITALEADVRTDGAWKVDNALISVRPFGVEWESGDWLELYVRRYQDVPASPFELYPGVTLPPASYVWTRVELGFATDNSRPLSAGLTASSGGFYGGSSTDLTYEGSASVAPRVVAGVTGTVRRVRLPEGRFTAHVHGVRLDYAASPRIATTARVQWDNETRRLAVNARLRWTPRPGRDVYVVYTTLWPTPAGERIRWSEPLAGTVIAKVTWYLRP